MDQLFQFLQNYIDYIILGLLSLMSVVLVWKIIERIMFYKSFNHRCKRTLYRFIRYGNRYSSYLLRIGARRRGH